VDLRHIAADDLRPAALMVTLTFVGFTVFEWIDLRPPAQLPVAGCNLATVALAFLLYVACRRVKLSPNGVYAAAALLSFAVLGNMLYSGLVGASPLFSSYVAILLIASAGSVLSAGWAIIIGIVEIVGWAWSASAILPAKDIEDNALLIASSAGVAAIVHVGRSDAERQIELQQALEDADEARRGLDRKVEERTTALRNELEERERLEEQLRHAHKLEAVGRLAGGIAHDFNNLLTVIRMSHITVNEPSASSDEIRDAMRDASDATDRAAGLTHDLLAFARKTTLARAPVPVTDVLGGVERMVRRVAEASIRLEVEIASDIGQVVADRHQIEQVLLNLAINACDAMAHRGTLTMSADIVDLTGGDATRRGVSPGSYARIAVTDTGSGMNEATMRSLFEPFFTTKEVGRGTGLGLAVAHGIVTQHCGHIEVESELGKGSTFTVYLPGTRGAPPRVPIAAAKPLSSLARETLLVVEDEAAVRRAVKRNLERLGYHVLAAYDGEDALRLVESLDGIDLLLSDVVMPGIDGPELACRLRAKWCDLPVLFVTGYSADRLARSDAVGPHDRVLEKPYQLEELARTIRGMLEARAARRVQPETPVHDS
jgi:signal transduction histidine kinase/ActR/RegA family two-component response regulator